MHKTFTRFCFQFLTKCVALRPVLVVNPALIMTFVVRMAIRTNRYDHSWYCRYFTCRWSGRHVGDTRSVVNRHGTRVLGATALSRKNRSIFSVASQMVRFLSFHHTRNIGIWTFSISSVPIDLLMRWGFWKHNLIRRKGFFRSTTAKFF